MTEPAAQSIFPQESVWLDCERIFQLQSPANLKSWLLDTGSLTQRLTEESNQRFQVSVIRQQMDKPRLSEQRALSLKTNRVAFVREVILHGNDDAWVFARTVIPQTTLSGRLKSLRHLDNRPLGALLFADPHMERKKMELTRVDGHQLFPDQLGEANLVTAWGRRSVFYLDKKPLLVSEFFLPSFVQHLKNKSNK